MTRLELSNTLIDRVGFKADPNYNLSAEVTATEGRYFQDAHSFVSVDNILALQGIKNPSEAEINDYLVELKKQNALRVVDDAFSEVVLNDLDLAGQENLFDAALAQRMVIHLSEMAYTSSRINREERISKEVAQRLFFDVNGDPNFPNKISISGNYLKEITQLRDRFNTEQTLDQVTLGTLDYFDDRSKLRFE